MTSTHELLVSTFKPKTFLYYNNSLWSYLISLTIECSDHIQVYLFIRKTPTYPNFTRYFQAHDLKRSKFQNLSNTNEDS
jgi:hypothetical protein